MVRTHVTLATIFWLPRQCRGERMSSVTSGARAFRAVRIDPPDPAVGPGARFKLPCARVFHRRTVALLAAINRRRAAFHYFAQHVVELADEGRRVRMM